jgi:hypothetical protein
MRVIRVPPGPFPPADDADAAGRDDVSLFSRYIMKYPVNACSVTDALDDAAVHRIRAHRRLVWIPVAESGEPALASEDPHEAPTADDGSPAPPMGTDAVVLSWHPLRYAVNAAGARILNEQLVPVEQSLVRSIRTLAETGLLRVHLPPGDAPGTAVLNAKDWLPDVELGPVFVAASVVVLASVAAAVRFAFGKRKTGHHVPAAPG